MKIVRHAKRTLFNTKEKLLVRLSKKNEIRKFEDPQRTAIYQTVTLSEQQKQEIEAIVIEKEGLNVAYGAIGIGEITAIPTAPAIADAYYHFDGKLRNSLPLADTPYEKKKK